MNAESTIHCLRKRMVLLLALAAVPFAAAHAVTYCGSPQTATLYAGQTTAVGTVTFANDPDNLYVTYITTGDWKLQQTILQVPEPRPSAPRTKTGNSKLGQFKYQITHKRPLREYTYTIPITALSPDKRNAVVIAAQAVVVKLNGSGKVIASKTGRAAGHFLTDKERRQSVRIHIDKCKPLNNFWKAIEGWKDMEGRPFNGTPGALQAETPDLPRGSSDVTK